MDKKMFRYYRKKMRGGQTLLARAVDFVMFRIFAAIILFIIFLYWCRSFMVAALIAMFLTIALSLSLQLVRQKRTKAFIQKDLERIKEKCLLESLTFMSLKDFEIYLSRLLGGFSDIKRCRAGFTAQKDGKKVFAFHNHPLMRIEVNDVLNILRDCRQPIIMISLSDFNEGTIALCKSMEYNIELISGSRLLEMARKNSMMPDEETAQRRAEQEMRDAILTIDVLKKSVLDKTKAKRYIICGVIVMMWSLITGFRIYYPIIAVICFSLAVIAFKNARLYDKNTGTGLS